MCMVEGGDGGAVLVDVVRELKENWRKFKNEDGGVERLDAMVKVIDGAKSSKNDEDNKSKSEELARHSPGKDLKI